MNKVLDIFAVAVVGATFLALAGIFVYALFQQGEWLLVGIVAGVVLFIWSAVRIVDRGLM